MTIAPADFTTNFPEFEVASRYPTTVIQFYIGLAYTLLRAERWGSTLDYGVQLFVAHNMVLEYQAQKAATTGAPPGIASGPVASKSAGPVSLSWATASASELNAGHWNNTTYGQRYIRLARMFGIGGLQLGIGCGPAFAGGAWVGPPPWPGWFSS